MNPEFSSAPRENTHVTAVVAGAGVAFTWDADPRIEVGDLGGEVVIETNAAGLRALARHLLVLAGDGVPDGGPHAPRREQRAGGRVRRPSA
ncbi:Imm32 family immunity protein [Streptomyces sp. NPDC001809]